MAEFDARSSYSVDRSSLNPTGYLDSRDRTMFTTYERQILAAYFQSDPYPDSTMRNHIAQGRAQSDHQMVHAKHFLFYFLFCYSKLFSQEGLPTK